MLTDEQIAAIQGENDGGTITVDGQGVSVEMAFQFTYRPQGLTAAFWQGAAQTRVGDFNGDGKDDIVNLQPDGNNWLASPYDDVLPNITLALSPTSVTEDGTSNLVYTFTRTGVTTNALTVNYTVGGTATFNTDYTQTGAASFNATTGTVTFVANSATATVTIDPTADTTIESNETVALTLTFGTGYTVGTTDAVTGTILNDDSATISINDVTVIEGNNGTTNAVFTVNLSSAVDTPITLNYATANGTATTLDNDYLALTSTPLTFNAGETSKTITVQINGDTKVEPNETFFVNLSNLNANGRNVTIADNQGQGTITNDDSSNIINGTPNRDTLTGTPQDDIITGLQGADTLTGGGGNDQFVYQNIRDAGDIITDFTVGQDKIVLTALLNSLSYTGINPIADNYVKFGTVGSNTVIQIDKDGNGPLTPTSFITVQNVSLTTLNTPNNFIF